MVLSEDALCNIDIVCNVWIDCWAVRQGMRLKPDADLSRDVVGKGSRPCRARVSQAYMFSI